MATEAPRIGFTGFGEVGYHLAKGFKGAGIQSIYAYNNGSRERPPYSDAFKARASSIGVELVSSAKELAERADIVFSSVIPVTATNAAAEMAPHKPKMYVDVNAISPHTKRECAELITQAGGRFVEVQIMGAPMNQAQATPMVVAGEAAEEFKALMSAYGMDLTVAHGDVGVASMIKMLRDIMTKGFMAISLELLFAARRAGLPVESIPSGFIDIAAYAKGRGVPHTAIHAARRVGEMEHVCETLESLGIEPIMAQAIRDRLAWCASFNLKDHFGSELPSSYQEVFDIIEQRSGGNANR